MKNFRGAKFISNDRPALLTGFASLIGQYEAFILDQWGVLHDGNKPYGGVIPLLNELRRRGKEVLILTNSSRSAARNIERLESQFGIPQLLYKTLISPADLIREWLHGSYQIAGVRSPKAVFVCTDQDDERLLDGLDISVVGDVARADAVIILSIPAVNLRNGRHAWIDTAIHNALPLICPSSDIHAVRSGGVHGGMAGVINCYAELGGHIHNLGKPSHHIYARCIQDMETSDPSRVLMVGDQIASDIVGARAQSWHTALVKTGAGKRSLEASDIRPEYIVDELRL